MKKYFRDTSNLISFALGAIMSFIFFIFNREMKVPIWVLLIVVFFLVITIWLLVKSRIELKDLSPNTHIQIIECSHDVCLCKPNNIIAYASWVTFYHCSGNYEHIIAYGNVETITQSGVAQIKVFSIDPNNLDILDYINNEKANILIRPALTTEAIKQINNYI